MATIPANDIPTLSLLYKVGKLSTAPAHAKFPITRLGPLDPPAPSKALNDTVSLIRGDITRLKVDAIVNAANNSLLGGGGVDGAIHRAAGPGLFDECSRLGGCPTGSAKITDAYELPCKRVIHAVGPIYSSVDGQRSERDLTGCYTASLRLAAQEGLRTVAFSALSTGAYGYPSRLAAAAALSAVRKFLTEEGHGKMDKVVLVTFEQKDWDAYVAMLPHFFPPVPEKPAEETKTKEKEMEEKLEAEAQAVARELPSPPSVDPADPEHVDKRPKPSQP